jgi:hypothetical protein
LKKRSKNGGIFMNKRWFVLAAALLAFSIAFIGCGGGGGEEEDDGTPPGTLPETLAIGGVYDGKWLVEGEYKVNSKSVIVKYPLDAYTFQPGDFVKITYTLISVTPGFKQGNAKFSFDGVRCTGTEEGYANAAPPRILGGWYQGWNNDAKIQGPEWKTTVANQTLTGSYQYKITPEDIAANNAAAASAELNPNGDLEAYTEEWVGFYFDNPLDTLADGTKVSFIIKDLKIEPEDVTLYTVTFNANGGKEESVSFQARGGQPVAAVKVPTFSHDTKIFYGWVTNATHSAEQAVNPTTTEIGADTTFYALWGTTVKTPIAAGTGSIKAGEANPSSDILVTDLQSAAATATLEIALSIPATGEEGNVYPGDDWGVGALVQDVTGWPTIVEIKTPNPGPATVDGKKSFTLSWTVAELLAEIPEGTSGVKINGWGFLQSAALEWSIDIVTFTIE